jgi:hypothetical protein
VNEDATTVALFQASTIPVIGNGEKTSFWKDDWLDGQSIAELAPELVDAVPPRRHAERTVASALRNGEWIRDVTGPRTVPVMVQYVHVRERPQTVQLAREVEDRLIWHWSESGT